MLMKLNRRAKAIAPLVSTLLLMAVIIFAVSVTLTFVQNNLTLRGAENDFNSMKSFMRTVGLQVDDVAWVAGRTETARYTTQFGSITLSDPLITYSVEVGRKTDSISWIQTTDTDFNTGTFAQTKIVGSGTGALLSLDQYSAPRSINQYVSNNVSDVDSSPSIGSHSNFVNQQSGPDSNYDLLTEDESLFEQVTVSSEKSTSNDEWDDVPEATVSFTPGSSTEEWLVILSADIRSNSLSEDQARFRYAINGVPQGEMGVQQGTTSASPIDPYNVYFHFSRITGTTSEQTVKFQFQASSGATAYTRNIHMLCISLDWAGLEYMEVNGDTLITGNQTLADLQFTPSSPSDYIVMYSAQISELPIDAGAETWLDFDNGAALYPNAWTTPNTRRIHTDRDQFEPHGSLMKINLDASQHSLKVQSQLRTAGDDCTARDVRVAAFRVDAFDLLEFDEDIAVSSTTADNVVRSAVTTSDPGEERDFLILAGIQTIASSTSSREAGGVEVDDVLVQRKGDQRLSYSDAARIASQYASVKTSSTSFTVETTYGRGGAGSDTIYSKQSVIYVLKLPKNYELDLEVQFTDVSSSVENKTLCIFTGTLGSEDLQVDAWNGTGWENVEQNLTSNSWNNYTVSLTTSTYTIRFKGSSETGDPIQDSWEIDAVLLWLSDDDYSYYYASGNFISQSEDTSGTTVFDQISWTNICPNETDIKVQIRSASTEGGLDSAQWYGPTGTSDYYINYQGSDINVIHDNGQWIQYKVYLTTANPAMVTPELLDLTITYRLIQYYEVASDQVRVLFYNIPILDYHLSNDYYELILPTQIENLVQSGTSAPTTQVFAIQKNPIVGQDDYIRGVVAPVIRYVTANISSGQQSINYVKLYLPNLVAGDQPRASQSITLSSVAATVTRESNVERLRISVSFPLGSSGFDNSFFQFPETIQEIDVAEGSELEFHRSEVRVDMGL